MTDEEIDIEDNKVFAKREKEGLSPSLIRVAEWLDGQYGVTDWRFDLLNDTFQYADKMAKEQREICESGARGASWLAVERTGGRSACRWSYS